MGCTAKKMGGVRGRYGYIRPKVTEAVIKEYYSKPTVKPKKRK